MKILDAAKTSYLGLAHNKTRSALTMLGIVIGISSVILLMSIGKSAQDLILNQVKSIGSNLIFIVPGGSGGSKYSPPSSVQGVIIKTLGNDDLRALEREPTISKVTAEVRGQARIVYGNNDKSILYEGVTEDFFAMRNYNTESGRFFTKTDVESFNRVAVIGYELAKTLFGEKNPVGKSIRVRERSFQVIGVLEKKGLGPFGIDQDNLVLIPITVAQKQLLGIDYYQAVTVEVSDSYNIEFAKARIVTILRTNHHITNPDKDDFTLRTQEDALETLGSITTILQLFLTAIASISLVVGGIGIMNIMLVSVTERTKEIGLRKAVGAKNKDILTQFLIEAIIITFLGGMAGIVIGGTLTYATYLLISTMFDVGWTFNLPLSAILISVFVASVTGLVFGLYPARQAARKNPVDTLRYE